MSDVKVFLTEENRNYYPTLFFVSEDRKSLEKIVLSFGMPYQVYTKETLPFFLKKLAENCPQIFDIGTYICFRAFYDHNKEYVFEEDEVAEISNMIVTGENVVKFLYHPVKYVDAISNSVLSGELDDLNFSKIEVIKLSSKANILTVEIEEIKKQISGIFNA